MARLGGLLERPAAAFREPEPPPAQETPTHPLKGVAGAALLVFGALLFLTASFGRRFSKVGWEANSIYVTEVAFAIVILLALVALKPRGFIARVARLPLIPLALYWLAGAIAALRGINEYGISQTLHDIGLVEYSIVLVLVALVLGTREQAHWLLKVVMAGGVVAIVFFACASIFGADVPPWKWATIGSGATSIYIACFVAGIAGLAASGIKVPTWTWPIAWAGLVLIGLTYARASWLAAATALLALVILAPRSFRLRAAALGTALVVSATVAAVGAEKLQISGNAGELRAAAEAIEASSIQKQREARGESVDDPATPEDEGADGGSGGGGGGGGGDDVEIPQAVRETFQNNISDGSNNRWRLAIWEHDVKEAAKAPIAGVGYGTPTAFVWDENGTLYDGRTGSGLNEDVSGPHNSFVNILFRTGLLGFGALVALVAIAAVRLWPWLRTSDSPQTERAVLVGVSTAFVFITVVAFFNVALEGPFMGIFWWTALGLLLILPKLYGTPAPSPQRSGPK